MNSQHNCARIHSPNIRAHIDEHASNQCYDNCVDHCVNELEEILSKRLLYFTRKHVGKDWSRNGIMPLCDDLRARLAVL